MTHTEFEQFRDLPEKSIDGDIRFAVKRNHDSILAAGGIAIRNTLGVDAFLEIHYNPDADSKVFTVVSAKANGPICRLCVDNGPHPPCMHSHKHALLSPACPRNNLKTDVTDKPELDGMAIADVFKIFCGLLKIEHKGIFHSPA